VRQVAALLLGAVVALAAVLVHRIGLLTLVLAVVTSLATAGWLRQRSHPWTASAFCLGWVAVLGLVLAGRSEGDWAIGADLAGYTLMGTGLVLVVYGVTALRARRSTGRT